MNAAVLFDELSSTDLRRVREALLDSLEEPAGGPRLDRGEILQRLLGSELCRQLGIFCLPTGFCLSVVMPVYNEIRTLAQVIERVRSTNLPLELVIVDDGSRDG